MYKPTREKLLHTMSFGPTVYLVDTAIESDVHRLTDEACARFGWAHLTTMASANPFNVEGYKTISYEIVRDTGLPDVVAIPIGSGTLGLGIWKGFRELLAIGIIPSLPRLIGVQPSNVAPIVEAYKRGDAEVSAVAPNPTAASGAVVDNPGISGTALLAAVRESGGCMIGVSEEDILSTWAELPQQDGLFAEPTGALSIAGMVRAREGELIKAGELVVCINSASGFKDIGLFERQALDGVLHVAPSIDALAELVQKGR
jgi:threonine synthase